MRPSSATSVSRSVGPEDLEDRALAPEPTGRQLVETAALPGEVDGE
jgi:hypothetical protein